MSVAREIKDIKESEQVESEFLRLEEDPSVITVNRPYFYDILEMLLSN